MTFQNSAGQALVWLLVVAAAGAGCGATPPYRVFEPPPPTAEQLNRLGRIDMAPSPAGVADEAATPRVWIGMPDRRAEGAVLGAVAGGIIGALAGGAIAGPSESEGFLDLNFDQEIGVAVGALVGAPVGAVIGASLGQPGAEARAAAQELRRHAAAVDVSALARDGASESSQLQAYREPGPAAGLGGTLSVEVLAYGTRAAGGGRAQPFVAIRTRLTDAGTGRVIYQSTSDWRGSKRQFSKWAEENGADFRRELEDGARNLGRRSVDRALTPRKR